MRLTDLSLEIPDYGIVQGALPDASAAIVNERFLSVIENLSTSLRLILLRRLLEGRTQSRDFSMDDHIDRLLSRVGGVPVS